MTQITIDLPENLVESAQRLGQATARNLSDTLADALGVVLPVFSNLSEIGDRIELSHLLDIEIIELANLKMDVFQNQRLGYLQAKGKQTGLTEAEGYELLVLISIYQMGRYKICDRNFFVRSSLGF